MMKVLSVVYNYSLDNMEVKIALAFDAVSFPVKIELDKTCFVSKADLIDTLREAADKMGYKTMQLLSNEAFNAAMEDDQIKTNLLMLFKNFGEEIPIKEVNKSGFFSSIFGRD